MAARGKPIPIAVARRRMLAAATRYRNEIDRYTDAVNRERQAQAENTQSIVYWLKRLAEGSVVNTSSVLTKNEPRRAAKKRPRKGR